MLGLKGKKILLGIHITFISIWIGTLIVVLLLMFIKNSSFNISQIAVVDKVIFLLSDNIIMNVSIAVALSGLIFSMFTSWGFIKFYWIIVKWILVILLGCVIMFLSGPAMNGAAALSDVFNVQVLSNPDYLQYEKLSLQYSLIQIILLIFIVFISVIKPWGPRKTKKKTNRKIVLSAGLIFGIALIGSIVSQYLQLQHFRNLKINVINLDTIPDGNYHGKVDYAFEYEVAVKVENHRISDIQFLKNRDSYYAKLAEGIKYKIIREQKIDIDAVTGATTTSKIFLKAVEKALSSN